MKKAPAAKAAIKQPPLTTFDRVDAIRARRGLSAKELCRRAGLDESTLAKAKAGGGNLSLQSLQALAPKLGEGHSELLGEAAPAAAIIPAAAGVPLSSDDPGGVALVPLAEIHPSPLNPRKTFTPAELDELAASIAVHGVLQPLLLRPREPDKTGRGGYWIVFGERRWRAASICQGDGRVDPDFHVPATIRPMTDAEHLVLALVENSQREDVPPLEEAEGYAALQKLDPATWSGAEIARSVGKSPRHVQIRLQLVANLAAPTKKALARGDINLAQARVIAELRVPPKRQANYVDVLASHAQEGDEFKAEDLRDWIVEDLTPIERAAFDVQASGLETFTDEETGGIYFRDHDAFLKKQRAHADGEIKVLEAQWKWVKEVESYDSSAYAKAADKTTAGAVVEFNPRTGALKIHGGVVKAGSKNAAKPKAGGSKPTGGGADYAARRTAEHAMRDAFRAHAATTAREAVLLFVFCALAHWKSGLPSFGDGDGVGKAAVEGSVLRAMKRFLTARRDHYTLKEDADIVAAWRILASVPNEELIPALGAVIADQLEVFDIDGGTWLLAQELGLKLAEKHDGTWRKELAGKVPGIELDIEDAALAAKAQGRDVEDAARRAKKKAAE